MQNKSLFYWIFYILGQYLCPKNAFRLIYIDIKDQINLKKMKDKMLKFVKVSQQNR